MGFITKNYYKADFDFLRHYGFKPNSDDVWVLTEIHGYDEIIISIDNTGENVTVTVGDRYFTSYTKRHSFKMDIKNINEKSYIDILDELVTTYLEEQGYDSFHNMDNRA